MKKTFLILIFCLPILTTVYSQTKQESIKELFHLMKQDSLIDKMFGSIVPSMIKELNTETSVAKEHSNEMVKSLMQTVKIITKQMINEDMVMLYDKYFSQNEINDFITFYKSPAGQKFIKVTPEIQQDITMIMIKKYLPEIQKLTLAKVEELKTSKK